MTLLIASAANESQIVLADRRLVDAASHTLIDDAEYKILNYQNVGQNYQCGVAYTGLARYGSFSTIDWLMDALPRGLDSSTDLSFAIDNLRKLCDSEYLLSVENAPHESKALTIVMCGRYDKYAGNADIAENVPFLVVISNCHDAHARQSVAVETNFRAFSARVLKRGRSISVCRGNTVAAGEKKSKLHQLFRYLRRDVPYDAKARLAAQYIQEVSPQSDGTVGTDVLGIAFHHGSIARGYDFSLNSDPMRNKTMPHFISDSGSRVTNFSVRPLREDEKTA